MPLAVLCRALGPPERLSFEDLPPAPLGPGEARIRLHACGVNFPDILTVLGQYQHKPDLPFIPGVESAGTIAELAPGVAHWRVGDRVITRQRTGGYAEEIVLPAAQLVRLPAGFSFAEGACFLVAGITAYHALVQRAALRPGESLLVHGAAGGVGLAAVELGKLLGARVIAAASSAEKLAAARARGADAVIQYSAEDFVEAVRRLTDGAGADVIFDPVGGEVLVQSLRAIAWGGRLLVVGFAGGTIPALAANRILLKSCAVLGVRAGEAQRRDPALAQAAVAALQTYAERGHLRPHLCASLPLAHYAQGMRLLMDRRAIGRVALLPGG
ncbi:MAG TPA: NADPH:quinone oxidoreductase family protein [Stellaceae bacterium]|nr:NADPH:quinone oxidoreductase family protein [Stellaceae bacterium]